MPLKNIPPYFPDQIAVDNDYAFDIFTILLMTVYILGDKSLN